MHKSQSLFYLITALHVSGVTITHFQEHKTTVNYSIWYPLHRTVVCCYRGRVGTGLSVLWVAYAKVVHLVGSTVEGYFDIVRLISPVSKNKTADAQTWEVGEPLAPFTFWNILLSVISFWKNALLLWMMIGFEWKKAQVAALKYTYLWHWIMYIWYINVPSETIILHGVCARSCCQTFSDEVNVDRISS
jgi:hypothetical protein